jgi:hypothetical protein
VAEPDYADDGRAYRAERLAREGERVAAERLVRALLAHAGVPLTGWLVQRQPTGAQCMTLTLDWLARKERAWLLAGLGRLMLVRHGLTLAQVDAWRAGGLS